MATLSHRTLPFSAAARACLLACAGSFTLPLPTHAFADAVLPRDMFCGQLQKGGGTRWSVLLFRESNVLANDANIGQAKAKVPRFSESLSSQLALSEVSPAFFPN